jgi:membrane protease subunit HflC
VDVRIKRLDYVESVREKVYERMISERKRIAAQFRSEGEGRSAERLGTMEKQTNPGKTHAPWASMSRNTLPPAAKIGK